MSEDLNLDVFVLRLGHRILRDKRVTTHVALAARALGCKGMYYSGEYDKDLERRIKTVNENWGGAFNITYIRKPLEFIEYWKIQKEARVVHLTMYGIPIMKVIDEIKNKVKKLLVIVGGKKVPIQYYKIANWNISITNQPHSEISALAIFLHELFERRELDIIFKNAKLKIIPQEQAKKVLKLI